MLQNTAGTGGAALPASACSCFCCTADCPRAMLALKPASTLMLPRPAGFIILTFIVIRKGSKHPEHPENAS